MDAEILNTNSSVFPITRISKKDQVAITNNGIIVRI